MSMNWLRRLKPPQEKPLESQGEVAFASDVPVVSDAETKEALFSAPLEQDGTLSQEAEPMEVAASFPVSAQPAPGPLAAPHSVFDFVEGQRVGELFQIKKMIGRGVFCSDYLASQIRWGTDVVLKVPNALIREDLKCLNCLARAGESWSALGLHPNVVYCHRVFPFERVPLLVVEYLDGGNLRDWIAEGWCADLKLGLDLAIQFCHALEFVHSRGLIHRAVKPENVLLSRAGSLKLADFGMMFSDCSSETLEKYRILKALSQHETLGEEAAPQLPYYLAPEQLDEHQTVDLRADIFAFGVCLYEMFCGAQPYPSTLGRRQEAPEPRLLRGDDSLTPRLCRLMKRCVDWDRLKRPQQVLEIRKELCAIYVELFQQASAYAPPPDVAKESEEEIQRLPWLVVEKVEAGEENDRAVALLKQGQEDEAQRAFQQIMASGHAGLEVTFNQALLLWRRGEIDDMEVLQRLDRLGAAPGIKSRALALAKAEIHQERCDPASACKVLADYPELYEKAFAGRESPQIGQRSVLKGHSKAGSAVAISPDGRRGLSGSNDHSLRLWDLVAGRLLHTVDLGSTGSCTVAMAGDGSIGLSDCQKALKLWNIETGQCLKTFEGHANYVIAVAMTPDGRVALSGGWDKTLKLWDVVTAQCLATLAGHGNYVTAVAMTPDGRRAVSGSWDGTMKLWDLANGRCLETFTGHANYVISVAITPDGRWALSGSMDKTLRFWSLESGRLVRILNGHANWVDSVAITADGRWAFSGSKDKTLRLWSLATGQCLRTLEGHAGGVSSVAITPDGRLGLSGSQDSTVRLWDLDLARQVLAEYKSGYSSKLPPQPETQSPAVARQEPSVEPPSPASPAPEPVKVPILPPRAVEPSPPAKPVATERDPSLIASQIETLCAEGHCREAFTRLVKAWTDAGFKQERRFEQIYFSLRKKGIPVSLHAVVPRFTMPQQGDHLLVAITAEGGRGVSAGSRCLKLWDLESGRERLSMEEHISRIVSAAITPDGSQAMSASADRTVKVWNLENGQCLRSLENVSPLALSVVLTGDGRHGISAGENNAVNFWDLRTGQCLLSLAGHAGKVNAVAITPDGRLGLSGSRDCRLKLWDMEAGSCMYTLEGHQKEVTAVALTPDGQRAISGSLDNTLRFWDLTTGDCLHTLSIASPACSLAVTPNGTRMLSGQENGTLTSWLLIWDLEFPEAR